MSQTPAEDFDRIIDYVGEELSPEDQVETARWIAQNDGRRALVDYLRQSRDRMMQEGMPPFGAEYADEVVRKVEARIAETKDAPREIARVTPWTSRDTQSPRMSALGQWHASSSVRWVGASLGVLVALVGFFLVQRGTSNDASLASGTRYTTTTGQRATVTLADGSRVTLAPQTTLTVAAGFGTSKRSVTVEGEAVFDVPMKTTLPFVVRTGTIAAQVLGTTFTVRRYPEDYSAHVAVIDGKVMVTATTSRRPSVVLSAGMVGAITDSSATSTVSADITTYTSWMHGRQVFQGAPVRDVLAAMRRWYGYEFQITDSALIDRNLTIGISTESATTALTALKAVWDVDFVYQGKVITVYPLRRGREHLSPRREMQATPRMEVGR